MALSRQQSKDLIGRTEEGQSLEQIEALMAPLSPAEKALPASIPSAPEATAARRELLSARGLGLAALSGQQAQPEAAALAGNIENFIGMAQVPVGLAGPLRIRGSQVQDDIYVPLATSEGALVASYNRGCRLISEAGGAQCLSSTAHVHRAPGFIFKTSAQAARFAAFAVGHFDELVQAAATRSRHGRLLELMPHLEGNHLYLVLSFYTADAAGQNMVTVCTEAVCSALLAAAPLQPEHSFVEANLSGDKKATHLGLLMTRGRKAQAEVRLSAALVQERLHTTPEAMARYWRLSFIGGVQTGTVGCSGHVANALAALFLACGQDIACVTEASVGLTRLEMTEDGGLYASVTLPNLVVGTVGGGTGLPTAAEGLRILGCDGPGKSGRFAEICAAVALAGELSIIGAICAGHFASAHAKLGRKPGGQA